MAPCTLHGGYITPLGYGRQSYMGRTVASHRLAYCKANGLALADIVGQVVRHKCDVRAYINPDHLELGTQLDNMHDMQERGRKVTATGAALPQTLPAEVVAEVRRMLATGINQRTVASRCGVSQATVSRILNGVAHGQDT